MELQYRVHAALDVVEEKCQTVGKGSPETKELYLGLLYATETHKMLVCGIFVQGCESNCLVLFERFFQLWICHKY